MSTHGMTVLLSSEHQLTGQSSPQLRKNKHLEKRARHKGVNRVSGTPRASKCQLRTCQTRSQDGAASIADALQSTVALWRQLAWSLKL